MKNIVILLALILSSMPLTAKAGSWYLAPTGGLLNATSSTFAYPHVSGGVTTMLPGQIKYKQGYYTGAIVGYEWTYVRVELETEFTSIGIRGVTVGGVPKRWGKSIEGFAALGNVIYQCPIGRFTPYIGAGFGAQSEFSCSIAYQALTGIKYRIQKDLSLNIDYKVRRGDGYRYDGLKISDPTARLLGISLQWSF